MDRTGESSGFFWFPCSCGVFLGSRCSDYVVWPCFVFERYFLYRGAVGFILTLCPASKLSLSQDLCLSLGGGGIGWSTFNDARYVRA